MVRFHVPFVKDFTPVENKVKLLILLQIFDLRGVCLWGFALMREVKVTVSKRLLANVSGKLIKLAEACHTPLMSLIFIYRKK